MGARAAFPGIRIGVMTANVSGAAGVSEWSRRMCSPKMGANEKCVPFSAVSGGKR